MCLAFWFPLLLKAVRENLDFSEFWAGFGTCFLPCFWAWGIFSESREVFLGGLKACSLQGFLHIPLGLAAALSWQSWCFLCGRKSFQGAGAKSNVYMRYKYIETCRTRVDMYAKSGIFACKGNVCL